MNKPLFTKRVGALITLTAFVIGLGAPQISLAAPAVNQSPKGILMEMSKRLEAVNSMNYSVDLDIDKNVPEDRVHLVAFGSIEQNAELNRNRASVTFLPLALEGEDVPKNLAIDLVTDSSTIYFKASGLPKEFLEEEKQVAKYADTWIQYSQSTIDYILAEVASSTSPEEKMIVESQISRLKALETDPARLAQQKEQYKKISDALFKRNAITITRLADVRLDPNDKTSPLLYRLKISFNKWGLGFFMKDLAKIMKEDTAVTESGMPNIFDLMMEDLSTEISSLKLPTIEILVGKNDYLPRKFTVSFYDQHSKKQTVNGTLTMTMDGFNAARPVAIPAQPKKLEDILKEEKFFEYLRAEFASRPSYEDFDEEDFILSTTTSEFTTSSGTISFVASSTDHIRGNVNAPVTIVEFSDFECPYCGQFRPVLTDILKQYGDKVRLVYKHYPISALHPNAQKAAEATECASEQGKFWEMHDKIFDGQQILSQPQLQMWAKDIGLEMNSFNQCFDSGKYAARVQADLKEGDQKGVQGTPATFINGMMITGMQTTTTLKQLIDKELAR